MTHRQPHRAPRAALLLAALFALFPAAAQAQLFRMSESQELSAGREADAQIRQKYHISSDPYYNNLVRHLGSRLVRVCDRPNIDWTFRVVDSKELNAFSVPGYVYVNTGLIQACGDDQDALAGVIGHEIGHTCGRHLVRQQEKGAVIGLLAGLIGSRNRTVGSLANIFANVELLRYSRDDENDADRRAVRYCLKAGYDPNGLIRFFDKLNALQGRGSGGVAAWFQTHPPTPDRIRKVKDEIAKQKDDAPMDRAYRSRGSDDRERP